MASPAAVRDLQRDLENKANDLSKIQKGKLPEHLPAAEYIAKNHQVRKKYTIQLGENELVLKELELLKEDANVYKLIGPVLVKQDLAEANANVRKRIEYISAELKRHDATLQDLEEKQSSKREAVCLTQLNSFLLSFISLVHNFSPHICISPFLSVFIEFSTTIDLSFDTLLPTFVCLLWSCH
ncbi:Prefoldin subunit 6 [Linum perenne]